MIAVHQNIKAYLKGIAVFLLASIASFSLLIADNNTDIAQIIWPSLIVAAFITALSAESFRLIFGIALSIPCAIGFGLESLAWEVWYLNSPVLPVEDFVLVFLMTLPYSMGFCALGALSGWGVHMIREHHLLERWLPFFSQ